MSEIKIEKEFIDNGFGFPVLIHDVEMIQIRGEWLPKINYAKLANNVLKELVIKKSRLTGNELRFIRLKFEMNLEDFAKRFYVSHPAVIKWESKKDMQTNMNWSTEKDIRLFIYNKLLNEDNFKDIYDQLEIEAKKESIQSFIDIKEPVFV